MIKQVILLFHLLVISIYGLFFNESIKVSFTGDTTVSVNQTGILTFTVYKNNLAGFAKLQVVFPDGFVVEGVEMAGSNYVYEENKAKFIWIALPPSETFSVKLKYVSARAGMHAISGKFYFIENNQPVNIDIPSFSIEVKDASTARHQEEIIQPYMHCTREIATTDNENFLVSIRITKNNIKGFAKIEEIIPNGFQAQSLQSAGAAFGVKDGILKYSWAEMPEENDLVLTYKLTPKINAKEGEYTISGTFSYNDFNETKKMPYQSSTFFYRKSQPVPIPASPAPEPKKVPAVTETPPKPSGTVTYRVQIAAGHIPVSDSYFISKYRLNEKINRENHEGWIKYTVGNFGEYSAAREKRNTLWNAHNLRDAFVVAYNKGNRISVQEALMITSQQWIK